MKTDIIIIGGGIVGLSTAWSILEKNPSAGVILIEKEKETCLHQTGNNSGVIHSGIYYKPGSKKAENCIRGYGMLLDFAKENQIPFELCGKLIVAVKEEELPRLENLYKRGLENGLDKISRLNPDDIREIEPNVRSLDGLFVPYTGIIDYKLVCRKLEEKITLKGGRIILGEKLLNIREEGDSLCAITPSGKYYGSLLINTAGLFSDRVASMCVPVTDYRIIPFRGEYYRLSDRSKMLVRNLVYPVPDPDFPFLGVHFTRMMDGSAEAGPNAVFSFKREGYNKTSFSFQDSWLSFSWPGFRKLMFSYLGMGLGEFYRSYNKAAFTRALQRLVPGIRPEDLVKGGAGVRAQACDRNGRLIDDFIILEEKRSIHVLNAPSPAATSSLSIGDTISKRALGKLME